MSRSRNEYQLTSSTTEATCELLKAVVALNAWAEEARSDGWFVDFYTPGDGGSVSLTVTRGKWPKFPREEEGK
jgi:hypothetical protein